MTFHAHEPKKKRSNYEENLQCAVVQFLKLAREDGVLVFHPANGEARSIRTGAKLKRMGVLAGTPDLVIVLPGAQVRFLELKAPEGRQSKQQREFQDICRAGQTPYEIARSIDEALTILRRWGALKPDAIAGRAA